MGIESKNDQECLIMGKGVAFGKKWDRQFL